MHAHDTSEVRASAVEHSATVMTAQSKMANRAGIVLDDLTNLLH